MSSPSTTLQEARRLELIAAGAIVGLAFFAATALLLPLVSEYSLTADYISELAIGRYGYLQTAAFFAAGLGTLALTLAEPEGYVRTFVDEGPQIATLLAEVLEAHQRRYRELSDHPSAHYLRKLLATLEQVASGTTPLTAELPEPLSERELEVLQLIAAGKSNRRIAAELFVSVGTVKTHIRNIYRKLDAHSRTQALVRARELNLI